MLCSLVNYVLTVQWNLLFIYPEDGGSHVVPKQKYISDYSQSHPRNLSKLETLSMTTILAYQLPLFN